MVQFEILPKPPAERAPTTRGRSGRRSTASTTARRKAAARFGADPRHFCIQTKRFVGDDNGRVKAIETVAIGWVSDNGRFVPREISGTDKT
jgi:glutamate synthase (NADPH/NADH) small chain